MSASAPKEGKDAHAPAAAEKPKGDVKVEAVAKDTAGKAMAAVEVPKGHGEVLEHKDDYKRPKFLEYTPLPQAPSLKTGTTAAATGLVVGMPPVGIPLVAGAVVGSKIWGVAKKFSPFSWVNSAVKGAVNVGKKAVSSVAETASYPFRLAGTAYINTIKAIARPIHFVGERSMDFLDDLRVVAKQRAGVTDEKGESISLPALALLEAKKAAATVVSLPLKLAGMYLNALTTKPLMTIGGTALAAGILSSHGGPLLFSQKLATAILHIFEGLANTAAAPAAAPAAGAAGAWPKFIPKFW